MHVLGTALKVPYVPGICVSPYHYLWKVFFSYIWLFIFCGKEPSIPCPVQNETIDCSPLWKLFILEDVETFDLCFSLSLSILDRSNKILENHFSSVCFLKLSNTVLLSSVIFMMFLQICTPDRFSTVLCGTEKFHPLPLMKPLFVQHTIGLKFLAATCSWLSF